MAEMKMITCKGIIQDFIDAGLVPNLCRRIVIDLGVDNLVTMFYECYGDKRLIELDLPGKIGAAIKIKEAEKSNGTSQGQ